MKRIIGCVFVLLVSFITAGSTSDQEFTQDTAQARILNVIPSCGDGLQSFNAITSIEQNGTGYTITVKQSCEPLSGEGPQMETIFRYSVSPNEIIRLDEE
ncbi:hypothetical protein [Paenibacillus dakarensis]|uniref:hypothetical protein n=1 Tax=Paenibacillus dakarensis TaxID=1527293 RepID=UPI0006D59456|nr:hypothetical protein [Paenibacillus dakarensis]